MHVSSGILFNYKFPLRGIEFVTRKIIDDVAGIKLGLQANFRFGNLDAKLDWGPAQEYVEAMWLKLQQDTPYDYVVATGRAESVRQFCELAFEHAEPNANDHVAINPKFLRPAEVEVLLGDPTKAQKHLGWTTTVTLERVSMTPDWQAGARCRWFLQ